MKARPDLNPRDAEVLSNPDNYYVDSQGHVNELEDDEERILFGTVGHPKPEPEKWFREPPVTPEDRLWTEAERDVLRAMNPDTNPHLKAVEALIGILESSRLPSIQRPKDAHIVPITGEEDEGEQT